MYWKIFAPAFCHSTLYSCSGVTLCSHFKTTLPPRIAYRGIISSSRSIFPMQLQPATRMHTHLVIIYLLLCLHCRERAGIRYSLITQRRLTISAWCSPAFLQVLRLIGTALCHYGKWFGAVFENDWQTSAACEALGGGAGPHRLRHEIWAISGTIYSRR